MNRDEIMNMQSGIELDALVAEKVMGWKAAGPNFHDQEENFVETVKHWKPSSSISVAWEVVEKLRDSHLYTDIRTCADFYEVWITNHTNGQQTETFAAPKLPEAICRAALLFLIQEDTP